MCSGFTGSQHHNLSCAERHLLERGRLFSKQSAEASIASTSTTMTAIMQIIKIFSIRVCLCISFLERVLISDLHFLLSNILICVYMEVGSELPKVLFWALFLALLKVFLL